MTNGGSVFPRGCGNFLRNATMDNSDTGSSSAVRSYTFSMAPDNEIWLQSGKTMEIVMELAMKPGTPRPTIYKRLFQLDDSQSLHRKWLEITKHPFFNGCLGFQEEMYSPEKLTNRPPQKTNGWKTVLSFETVPFLRDISGSNLIV